LAGVVAVAESSPETGISRQTVAILAVVCAVTVSNIYFPQPLLAVIARDFGVADQTAGLVVSMGQIGYALGLATIVPLGDTANLRRLAVVLPAVTTVGLLVAAVAPNLATLAVATVALSTATVLPQVIVPASATMAGPGRSGRVLARLGVGLTLGVVLSRTVSGFVTDLSGSWRVAYVVAAVLTAATAVLLPRRIPERVAHDRPPVRYRRLLASLPGLLVAHPAMRLSAGLGAAMFAAYSGFWATVTFHLAGPPFHLGATYAGALGLVSLPGALLAARLGRLCDRSGPAVVNALGLATAAAGLTTLWLGQDSLVMIVVGSNVLGFGVAGGTIANQTRIFGLPVDVRSRLNTVYMTSTFVGAALGSAIATTVYTHAGWTTTMAVLGAFVVLAAAVLAALRPNS
jgi:predicted MFS family arabinose efflux permease